MANNNNNNNEEPSTAPQPDRWYNIKLGHSFKDQHQHQHSSPKFCTLRYEFKPASIDKNQPGTFHKSKNNRVNVEFQNNQHGKPKVTFEGVSEDYKDNDAVLFFDGESFRLERLHRAVKRLRHVRLPGESVAAAASTTVDSCSPPVGKGVKVLSLNKGTVHQVPAQVEQIDLGDSESLEPKNEKDVENPSSLHSPLTASPDPKNYKSEEHVDIVDDDNDGSKTAKTGNFSEKKFTGIDINLPHQVEIDDEVAVDDINLPHQVEIDDEVAVDVSDVEADKGPNAAEALRAQVNAEGRGEQTSSSSTSSGSDSSESGSGSDSGSGSGTSSSDSESSDGGSVSFT